MTNLLSILNDKIVIKSLVLESLSGSITHDGSLTVQESVSIAKDLSVNGHLYVDTLTVNKLNTESVASLNSGTWSFENELDLNGKGFSWELPEKNTQLIYRTGARLWTNANIDLADGSSYKIDNVDVLSAGALGASITKSNLREIGALRSLNVTGNAVLGEFAYFNDGRLGLGTDEPNASISIVENDVEITIGSPKYGQAAIGTRTLHDVAIVSNNVPRIVVTGAGEVQIGDPVGKSGVLRVFGELHVDSIITDTRIERSSPLEFKATRDTSIYGKGLVWSGTGNTRQLLMMAGPDRLFSSESIAIAADQCFMVNDAVVLTEHALGQGVVNSSLTSVGTLHSLSVQGTTKLSADIDASTANMTVNSVAVNSPSGNIVINKDGVSANKHLALSVNNVEAFYADANEIAIGSATNTRTPIKMNGLVQATAGIFTTHLNLDGKLFTTDNNYPDNGFSSKGSICWNDNPTPGSYIGWVCIAEGTPGAWAPFGAIVAQ